MSECNYKIYGDVSFASAIKLASTIKFMIGFDIINGRIIIYPNSDYIKPFMGRSLKECLPGYVVPLTSYHRGHSNIDNDIILAIITKILRAFNIIDIKNINNDIFWTMIDRLGIGYINSDSPVSRRVRLKIFALNYYLNGMQNNLKADFKIDFQYSAVREDYVFNNISLNELYSSWSNLFNPDELKYIKTKYTYRKGH